MMRLLSLLFLFSIFFNHSLSAQSKEEDKIYHESEVDSKPEFTGGDHAKMNFIARNISYPEEAMRAGIDGKVVIRAVVEKNGKIKPIEVLEAPHKSLGRACKRTVLLMPKWIPGEIDGEPVRTYTDITIIYNLRD